MCPTTPNSSQIAWFRASRSPKTTQIAWFRASRSPNTTQIAWFGASQSPQATQITWFGASQSPRLASSRQGEGPAAVAEPLQYTMLYHCIHVSTHACMRTYTHIHVYIHIYIPYINTELSNIAQHCINTLQPWHTYNHSYMHAYTHSSTHKHIYPSIHTYIHAHTRTNSQRAGKQGWQGAPCARGPGALPP